MGFTTKDFLILLLIFLLAVVLRWAIFNGPSWGRTLLKLLSLAAIPFSYKALNGLSWVDETLMIIGFFVVAAVCVWLVKRPMAWLIYCVNVIRGISKTVEKKAEVFAAIANNGEEGITLAHGDSNSTDELYALIASELENNDFDKGLWTKIFAECDGDETKTKVRYIRERLVVLSTQQPSR